MTLPDRDHHAADSLSDQDDAIIGLALRWSLVVVVVLGATGAALVFWWTRAELEPLDHPSTLQLPRVRDVENVEIPTVRFTRITELAGITFVHENGANGDKLLPETMGGGCAFLDYDNDGDQDLFLLNSARWPGDTAGTTGPPATSAMYENDGTGSFLDISVEVSLDLHEPIVGRGAAYADIDGDGDLDILLTQIAGPPLLLRNDQQLGHHFLRLKLVGTSSNRDAIGAAVSARVARDWYHRQVMPTRSYLSQMELPVTIGLGDHTSVDQLLIRWPDGFEQEVTDYEVDGLTVVVQADR